MRNFVLLAVMLLPASLSVPATASCGGCSESAVYDARVCDDECRPQAGWKSCHMLYCPRCAGGDREVCEGACRCVAQP